jgi:hypothetical protein
MKRHEYQVIHPPAQPPPHLAAGVVGVAGERETFAGCQFRRCISLCKADGQKNKRNRRKKRKVEGKVGER